MAPMLWFATAITGLFGVVSGILIYTGAQRNLREFTLSKTRNIQQHELKPYRKKMNMGKWIAWVGGAAIAIVLTHAVFT